MTGWINWTFQLELILLIVLYTTGGIAILFTLQPAFALLFRWGAFCRKKWGIK